MKFDVQLEYNSLLRLFYYERTENTYPTDCPYEMCAEYFRKMPFRGPYIDIMSFDRDRKFDFENKNDVSFEKLLLFCEYVYSYMCNIEKLDIHSLDQKDKIRFMKTHIEGILDRANYIFNQIGYAYEAVPKDGRVIAAAHIMNSERAKDMMHYLHRSMVGDLDGKRRILTELASELEAKRSMLTSASSKLSSDFFNVVNNYNIRHNNVDPRSSKYQRRIALLSNDELEEWYDRVYYMYIEAVLALERFQYEKDI